MRYALPIALLLTACTAGDTPDVRGPADDPTPDVTDADVPRPPITPGDDSLDPTRFGDDIGSDDVLIGTWRDLDHWLVWQELTGLNGPFAADNDRWGIDTRQRVRLQVTDGAGPVANAQATLSRGQTEAFVGVTSPSGEANLFGGVFDGRGGPWDVKTLTDRYVAQTFNVPAAGAAAVPIDLTDDTIPEATGIDVVFAVDTREPMATWLPLLQVGIDDWVADAAIATGQDVRATVQLFDDQRVVEGSLDDLDAALQALEATRASGDGAPRLDLILDALADADWDHDAALRTAFLFTLGDGVPERTVAALRGGILDASAQGVRIHVVQLDPEADGTFLMRNLTILTDGAWHFALQPGANDDAPGVGDFEVRALRTLVADVLSDAFTP